jgi:uncharacterized protein YigE (DUF2233 family)
MKKWFVGWLVGLAPFLSEGQFSAVTQHRFQGGEFDWFDLVLNARNLDRLSLEENQTEITHAEMVRRFPDDFLMTTTTFGTACQALGLMVREGKLLQDVNPSTSGNGNFFLQPNGALLQTPNELRITETADIQNLPVVRNGFQSGPMLVSRSAVNPNLNPASTNLNFRSGMGLYKGSDGQMHLVFVISRSPVTFHHLAKLFRESLKCEQALALTSANCAQTLPFQNDKSPASQQNLRCCGYIRFRINP